MYILEKSLENSTILFFCVRNARVLLFPFASPVFLGCHFHNFLKATVEGADGVVADGIGNLRNGRVGALQHFGSAADAQGIDVVGEADLQLVVECMGNVAEFIKDETGLLVMCGDLNVSAESPAMRKIDFFERLDCVK